MSDSGQNSPMGAVFLSYAREDAEAARRIADALRAFGMEAWFDQAELRGGDAWDQKIRTQIKTCALFMPLVSARTEARTEGYFRREWKLAIDRTHDMAPNRAFIVPVVIDETHESAAAVPEEFMRYQWTRLPRGVPTPDFVGQVKRLLDGPKKPAEGVANRASSVQTAPETAEPVPARVGRGGPLPVILGLVAVVAVAAAIYFAQHPKSAEVTVAARPAPAAPVLPPAVPVATVETKSIAVLPFSNLSEEKDGSFFADGIHEDILTNLALVRELHVVSRTSVMQYRNTTKSIRQIAGELGVAYVLEGSVRRAGNKVRVTGQLIKAATDEHVWAKAYDRDLTDIFSLQSELSQAIAAALSAALSPQEKQLLDRRPTENLAAYDAYVKARQLRTSGTPSVQAQAEPLLLQAVQLDPKFASAWAELAAFHAFQFFNDTDQTPERLAHAKTAIETAVRLAPDAPEVIEKQGDYYYYGYRDYERAIAQYQRLAILRPNDGVVVGSLGLIHRRQGRWRDALEELRRAAQLEPRSLRYVRSFYSTALALRRYDEAVAAQRRVIELVGDDPVETSLLPLVAYLASGSVQETKDWLAQVPAEKAREPVVIALRKVIAQTSGDFAGYVALDREQRYYAGLGNPPGYEDTVAAFMFAAGGDRTAAIKRANEAVTGLKAMLEKQPGNASCWSALGGAYALLGNRAESLRCAQKAKDLVPESRDSLVGPQFSSAYAGCLAWLGDKDAALAEFARLLQVPNGENVHTAGTSPFWFPLRGDPRFEALLKDPKNNAPL